MAVDLSAILCTFTDRERAVFTARAERLTRQQISDLLGISLRSVDRSIQNYERKLGKALMPLAYKAIAAGVATANDIALPRAPYSKRNGVWFHKRLGRWQARTGRPDGRRHLGTFNTEEEAIAALEAVAGSAA